jgi:hypothetical protein
VGGGELEGRSVREYVYQAVERLCAEGLTYSQVGERLGMRRGAVARTLRFAKDRRLADAAGIGIAEARRRRQAGELPRYPAED